MLSSFSSGGSSNGRALCSSLLAIVKSRRFLLLHTIPQSENLMEKKNTSIAIGARMVYYYDLQPYYQQGEEQQRQPRQPRHSSSTRLIFKECRFYTIPHNILSEKEDWYCCCCWSSTPKEEKDCCCSCWR